jgi:hypothetical protein
MDRPHELSPLPEEARRTSHNWLHPQEILFHIVRNS